jgi:peptide deformylase
LIVRFIVTFKKEEKMAVSPIRIYGDSVLRKRAKEITKVDEKIRKIAFEMLATLKDAGGIGLAANQVGEELRVFVVDRSIFQTEDSPLIVINPVLVDSLSEQTEEEGCLSIPGTYADVRRPSELIVKGIDLNEKEIIVEAKGLLSRVLAHEIDHLNGVLFIDHLSSIKRKLLSKKLKKLSAR